MRYNNIVLVCLSVLLNGCRTSLFINGKYSGKNPHFFTFSEDSTFKYEYRGVWYSESSGTWQKKENTIFLTSFEQRSKIPIEYLKLENEQEESIIKVKVNISDKSERDYICFPYINGKSLLDEEYPLDPPKRGSYSFETKVSVDSICFLIAKRPYILGGTGYKMSYDDVRTETIYPHLSVGENLNVTVNIIDSLFGYKVFKNQKLKIKKEKIVFKDRGKKNKLYLRR